MDHMERPHRTIDLSGSARSEEGSPVPVQVKTKLKRPEPLLLVGSNSQHRGSPRSRSASDMDEIARRTDELSLRGRPGAVTSHSSSSTASNGVGSGTSSYYPSNLSPTLVIESFADGESDRKTIDGHAAADGVRPNECSPVHLTEYLNSPYRATPPHSRKQQQGPIRFSPSSPLLTALREAVDSVSQYEDFVILEKIGAGFFAEVFKVRYKPTNEVMVLKVNRKRMNGLKKLKEVELLKKLSHQNILHYVGACVHEGQLHPLTEYVSGGALEQVIQNRALELPWRLRLQLALDIAHGMEYLHNNGMLHRDLNSKNCLLRKKEKRYTAVVADFGLAAVSPHYYRNLARSQSIVGNPYWMAPEVLNGKPYDEKADVFSYGIILCELISRLEADPEEIPRTKNFGLDEKQFRNLPAVKTSNCPPEMLELAFSCCRYLPVERPNFSEIVVRLNAITDTQLCNEVDLGIQPEPSKRLSCHGMKNIIIAKETVV